MVLSCEECTSRVIPRAPSSSPQGALPACVSTPPHWFLPIASGAGRGWAQSDVEVARSPALLGKFQHYHRGYDHCQYDLGNFTGYQPYFCHWAEVRAIAIGGCATKAACGKAGCHQGPCGKGVATKATSLEKKVVPQRRPVVKRRATKAHVVKGLPQRRPV